MFTLYEFSSSGNCYKLRLAMAMLNIDFNRVEIDITKGESRTPEFLALNANGRIPVLKTPAGEHLPESNAALWYLSSDSHLMPDDKLQQAQVLQWMFFEQYSHEPFIATSRYWIHILGKQAQYQNELQEKQPKGYAALAVMEQQLLQADFLVSNKLTAADIALYAYTHVAHEGGFDLNNYPAIGRWIARIAASPGYVSMDH